MTNRGVFGLPQGQRSGAASGASVPHFLLDVTTPYGNATASGAWPNNTYLEVIPANTYSTPIVLLGTSYVAVSNTAFGQVPIWWAIGPAGSEIALAEERLYVASGQPGGSVEQSNFQRLPFAYGLYVPAKQRVAIKQTSGGALTLMDLQVNWATLKPSSKRTAFTYGATEWNYVAATVATATAGTWYELGPVPPAPYASTGCWITQFSADTGIDCVLGFGPAGSEQAIAGQYATSGTNRNSLGRSNGYGQVFDIPPIWWPANTRLAFRPGTSRGTTNVQAQVRRNIG